MEKFEQYGDLTQEEYYSFLAEIEEEDESLNLAESESLESIAIKEEQAPLTEDPENAEIEALYGDDAWRSLNNAVIPRTKEAKKKAAEASSAYMKQKRLDAKLEKIRIQREAFDQTKLDLSKPLEKGAFKLLITLLVKEHTEMIERHTAFINKRFTLLLRPFIPLTLKNCKAKYPNAVRVSPGFLYRASTEYGEGLTFWASPDIPYYFKQNTEQEILMTHKARYLYSIDKAIAARQRHVKRRAEKEVTYASLLTQKKINTYFDLLKLNPFWFEALYKEVIK